MLVIQNFNMFHQAKIFFLYCLINVSYKNKIDLSQYYCNYRFFNADFF